MSYSARTLYISHQKLASLGSPLDSGRLSPKRPDSSFSKNEQTKPMDTRKSPLVLTSTNPIVLFTDPIAQEAEKIEKTFDCKSAPAQSPWVLASYSGHEKHSHSLQTKLVATQRAPLRNLGNSSNRLPSPLKRVLSTPTPRWAPDL